MVSISIRAPDYMRMGLAVSDEYHSMNVRGICIFVLLNARMSSTSEVGGAV